jgi:hypothetical protein
MLYSTKAGRISETGLDRSLKASGASPLFLAGGGALLGGGLGELPMAMAGVAVALHLVAFQQRCLCNAFATSAQPFGIFTSGEMRQSLGNPRLADARAIANAAHKAGADAHAEAVAPAIREAQAAGAKSQGGKAQIRHIDANREAAESARWARITVPDLEGKSPRNTKPASEGGPVSRQGRGISSDVAVPILPENLNRCKSHFWWRRSFA